MGQRKGRCSGTQQGCSASRKHPSCLRRFFGDVRPGQITVDGQALLLRMTAPQYELHELTIPSWPKFVPGDLSTIDNEKWDMRPIVGMSHSIMPRTTRLSAICHPCLLSMRCLMDKARRIFSINRPSSTSRSSFGLPIIWNS